MVLLLLADSGDWRLIGKADVAQDMGRKVASQALFEALLLAMPALGQKPVDETSNGYVADQMYGGYHGVCPFRSGRALRAACGTAILIRE